MIFFSILTGKNLVAIPGEKWQKSALFARYRRSFAVNVWALGAYLGVAGDEVFVGGDFGQSHWSTGV